MRLITPIQNARLKLQNYLGLPIFVGCCAPTQYDLSPSVSHFSMELEIFTRQYHPTTYTLWIDCCTVPPE